MRTAIEIQERHRLKLAKLAARRGEKDFSGIIEEALSLYFDNLAIFEENKVKALDLRGSLDKEESRQLYESVQKLRQSW